MIRPVNGLHVPDIHKSLDILTPLEERLISPRVAFTRIKALNYNEQQKGIKGNVVCVPIDNEKTLRALPRIDKYNEQIKLKFMRQMNYNKPYMEENIRPWVIKGALEYLDSNPNSIYKKANISIDMSCLDHLTVGNDLNDDINVDTASIRKTIDRVYAEEIRFKETYQINHNREVYDPTRPLESQSDDQVKKIERPHRIGNYSDEESFDEEEDNCNQDAIIIDSENMLKEVSLAPAQYGRTVSITADPYCEELTFIRLFNGEASSAKDNISPAARFKSYIRNYIRNFAQCPQFIFFAMMEKMKRSIIESINITCQQTTENLQLTKTDALNEETMRKKLFKYDAFQILNSIRSSPAHWNKRKREVNAMIRQLGTPTFFFTFSPAEIRWPELIRILLRTLRKDGEDDYSTKSDEFLLNLPRAKLYTLVSTDPVTCARYFDHRISKLRAFMFDGHGVFSMHPIVDYAWRIEFQERGSPHLHMLTWHKVSSS